MMLIDLLGFRGCCHNADCEGFETCDDCWNDYKENHRKTNADHIWDVSDEELAELLARWRREGFYENGGAGCMNAVELKDWRQQPAE